MRRRATGKDLIGKDGVEQTFEGVLRGRPRKLEVQVDSQGQVARRSRTRRPWPARTSSSPSTSTSSAWPSSRSPRGWKGARIRDQNEKQRLQNYRAGAGAVVALDPNDGSVV